MWDVSPGPIFPLQTFFPPSLPSWPHPCTSCQHIPRTTAREHSNMGTNVFQHTTPHFWAIVPYGWHTHTGLSVDSLRGVNIYTADLSQSLPLVECERERGKSIGALEFLVEWVKIDYTHKQSVDTICVWGRKEVGRNEFLERFLVVASREVWEVWMGEKGDSKLLNFSQPLPQF